MRRRSNSDGGRSTLVSTEPMTSPPTSSGWHVDSPGCAPQTSQVTISVVFGPWSTGRLRRTARHDRGLACSSGSASCESGPSGRAGSSRSALLLRIRTVIFASGIRARDARVRISWPSAWFSATCMASPKRAWPFV